jgi:hypothetical protein
MEAFRDMQYELRPATEADRAWLDDLRREVYYDLILSNFGEFDEERHRRHSRGCAEFAQAARS